MWVSGLRISVYKRFQTRRDAFQSGRYSEEEPVGLVLATLGPCEDVLYSSFLPFFKPLSDSVFHHAVPLVFSRFCSSIHSPDFTICS